jgi:hypothetical protein
MEQILTYEAKRPSSDQEIICLHGTRAIIIVLTKARHATRSYTKCNKAYILLSNFIEVHFNIIFSYTSATPKWFLQGFWLKFCMHFSPLPCVLITLPILSSVVSSCLMIVQIILYFYPHSYYFLFLSFTGLNKNILSLTSSKNEMCRVILNTLTIRMFRWM